MAGATLSSCADLLVERHLRDQRRCHAHRGIGLRPAGCGAAGSRASTGESASASPAVARPRGLHRHAPSSSPRCGRCVAASGIVHTGTSNVPTGSGASSARLVAGRVRPGIADPRDGLAVAGQRHLGARDACRWRSGRYPAPRRTVRSRSPDPRRAACSAPVTPLKRNVDAAVRGAAARRRWQGRTARSARRRPRRASPARAAGRPRASRRDGCRAHRRCRVATAMPACGSAAATRRCASRTSPQPLSPGAIAGLP